MGIFLKNCGRCAYYSGYAGAFCHFDEEPKKTSVKRWCFCKNYVRHNPKSKKGQQAIWRGEENLLEYEARTCKGGKYCGYDFDAKMFVAMQFDNAVRERPYLRARAVKWYLESNRGKRAISTSALIRLYGCGGFESVKDQEVLPRWDEVVRKEYDSLRERVGRGDSEAKMLLSRYYFCGTLVEQSIDEAIEMCISAKHAKKSLDIVEFVTQIDKELKTLYGSGVGDESFKRLEDCEKDIAEQQARADYKARLEALTKKASKDDASACFELAEIYLLGDEYTKKDENEGVELYIKASTNGNSEATSMLKKIVEGVYAVSDEAKRLAKKYLEQRAKKKEEERRKKAIELEKQSFEKARASAKSGGIESRLKYAMHYIQGLGVERDVTEGIRICLECEKDSPLATKKLVELYVESNIKRVSEPVLSQWKRSVEAELERQRLERERIERERRERQEAERRLAEEKARRERESLIKSANEGGRKACRSVAEKYFYGSDGFVKDINLAVEYYIKGYWAEVEILNFGAKKDWSEELDYYYNLFLGGYLARISYSIKASLPYELRQDVDAVEQDMKIRKATVARKQEQARAIEEEKREWANRKCKTCTYCHSERCEVAVNSSGTVTRIETRYYCFQVADGKTYVGLNNKCDRYVKRHTKEDSGYQ